MLAFTMRFALLIGLIAFAHVSVAQQTSLFNLDGDAIAYINMEEDLTIYLWGGEPMAYLDSDHDEGFHVYGFNGNHLGWFIDALSMITREMPWVSRRVPSACTPTTSPTKAIRSTPRTARIQNTRRTPPI